MPACSPIASPASADQLRRGGGILQHGGADAAGGIDIHMHGTAPFQLVPVLIGIPGRAGIAAMRMARPEAQPQARAATCRVRARRGAPPPAWWRWPAIVHHAVVPGVVMAGEQDERAIRRRAVDIGDQDRRLPPAGIDLGMQRHLRLLAARQTLAQRAAIGVRNGADDGGGQVGLRLDRRAAPDRRNAHLVQMLVRADMHLADRTGMRGARAPGRGWRCPPSARSRRADRVAAKSARVAVADIDQPPGHALRRRAAREGVRDAGRAPGCPHRRAPCRAG